MPGISANGKIAPHLEVKLVNSAGFSTSDKPHPRGEIFVRDPTSAPVSYWKLPDKTAEVVTVDGWYKTEDIGMLDCTEPEEPVLSIVGRKKNVLELYSGGQSVWVQFEKLEKEVFGPAPCCHQMYLDEARNANRMVAVVVPDQDFCTAWALQQGMNEEMAATREVRTSPLLAAAVLRALREAATTESARSAFGREILEVEIPGDVLLVHEPFTASNGGLTSIGKIARHALSKRILIARLEPIYARLEEVEESGQGSVGKGDREKEKEVVGAVEAAAASAAKPISILVAGAVSALLLSSESEEEEGKEASSEVAVLPMIEQLLPKP